MANDYSGTLRDIASRIIKTAQHVQRLGNIIGQLPSNTHEPTPVHTPDVDLPAQDGELVNIDGYMVCGWIAKIVLWAKSEGWTGHVTSGYRSDAAQALACIHVCGNPQGCPGTCAKPGTSNHRYKRYPGGAVDVDRPDTFGPLVARYPHGPTIRNNLPKDRGHFSLSGG